MTHEIAKRALGFAKPTVFLHVGDYDPSGESIFESMSWDARKFLIQYAAGEAEKFSDEMETEDVLAYFMATGEMPAGFPDLRPVRVALTEEQVEEHELETAPPKRTDSRTRNWVGETAQAEAMPPDLLAETTEEAIRDEIDVDRYDKECAAEGPDEAEIDRVLTDALGRRSG